MRDRLFLHIRALTARHIVKPIYVTEFEFSREMTVVGGGGEEFVPEVAGEVAMRMCILDSCLFMVYRIMVVLM